MHVKVSYLRWGVKLAKGKLLGSGTFKELGSSESRHYFSVGSILKPMRTGHKQGEMQLMLLPVGRDRHSVRPRNRERQNSCVSQVVFRESGTQVSTVTMSHPSPWLHPVCYYKRPLKEEEGLFAFWGFTLGFWTFCLAFCFLPLNIGKKLFTLGLLVWEAFGREKNY
jgi:hypothetical protein